MTELEQEAIEFMKKQPKDLEGHLVYKVMADFTAHKLKQLTAAPVTPVSQPGPEPHWIDFSKDQPLISGEYIVTFVSGTVSHAHWNASTKIWGTNRDGTSWLITHWQPFPESAHGAQPTPKGEK